MKFEISIIYTQIEIGLFLQFFSTSFDTYGHLVFPSYCVQLWQELEPQGITFRPAEHITWTPSPLCPGDKSIIEIAGQKYNKRGSARINRCRQFLQIISVVDLLIPFTNSIHPSYLEGYIPASRVSNIIWPPIPRSPKNYWKLWSHFIKEHLLDYIHALQVNWKLINLPRFSPACNKHNQSFHLYQLQDGILTMFKLQSGAQSRSKAIYTNAPYLCELPFNPQDFYPVDIHHNTMGISVLGDWYTVSLDVTQTNSSLEKAFHNLPLAIKQTCGNIHFPSDNGEQILNQINTLNSSLFGASNASFKDGRASHAWILSSENIDDIEDPDSMSGSGPVHGASQYLSSAHGEL